MSYVDESAITISVLSLKKQPCHMLMAQPYTYDMFALIEVYGRKLQSVYSTFLISPILPVLRMLHKIHTKYATLHFSLSFFATL